MIVVRFTGRELQVSVYGLEKGETPVVLIDHMLKGVHLFDSFYLCQRLLAAHGYEIEDDPTRRLGDLETLQNVVDRLLAEKRPEL